MKMSEIKIQTDCVNGDCDDSVAVASHGRVGVGKRAPPSRHHATVPNMHEEGVPEPSRQRRKWTTEENRTLINLYYKSEPGKRGYRQRLYRLWRSNGMKAASEQRLADQVRTILKKHWFSPLELEKLKSGEESIETSAESNEHEEIPTANTAQNNPVNNQDKIQKYMMKIEDRVSLPPLRKVNRRKLLEVAERLSDEAAKIPTRNITETNMLMYACARTAMDELDIKLKKPTKMNQCPWRIRIKRNIEKVRRELAKCIAYKDGTLKRNYEKRKIEGNCKKSKKNIETIIEEYKQRLAALVARLDRYENRSKQFRQNQLFRTNQRQLYKELSGQKEAGQDAPDAEEAKKFWSDLWDKPTTHNKNAKWLSDLMRQQVKQQNDFLATDENLTRQLRKMPNWKATGPDQVHGFWIKNLKSLHNRILQQLNDCIQNGNLPSWMTEGKTVLIMKDENKGTIVSNYRPIACLPTTYKLLTGMIAESMYEHLENSKQLPNEQKGCRKNSRGTKDQLLIDKMAITNSKRNKRNLHMAWIDYKKAYDMVPHSWILESLKLVGIATNIRRLIEASMTHWNTSLVAGDSMLGTVKIKRGIFQGDSLSPLLFIIAMRPLTSILRRHTAGYTLKNKRIKINHLLFMDDLKLYAKNEKEMQSIIQTVKIYSDDIRMEFGIEKCAVLQMKRGKLEASRGCKLTNGTIMRGLSDEETYKYLGIIEAEDIKHEDMKESVRKQYFDRTRKILKSKLNAGNTVKAMNTWAVSLVRYSAGIIKWNTEELQTMDRKTRKLMTAHGALHPKADVDRIYLPRKEGGRGLASIQDCVEGEEISLVNYMKENREELLQCAYTEGIVNGEANSTRKDYMRRKKRERKENWRNKELHGQFLRQNDEQSSKYQWAWLEKGLLKKETEALIQSAQDQALSTNSLKAKVFKQEISAKCRMCKDKDETVNHLLSECSKLAQREYKRRHDNVANVIHWSLCKKHDLPHKENWYQHNASKTQILENDECKILWDFNIQTDHVIEHRRPDIVVVEKKEGRAIIIDIAVPGDSRTNMKEEEKIERYQEISREIKKLWKLKETKVIPIVMGCLGTPPKKLDKWLDYLGVNIGVELIQRIALLGSAHILRKVLELPTNGIMEV